MAKTVEQLIYSVRKNLHEANDMRYRRFTTTSDGAADGTTAISTELASYLNDHFNGAFIRIVDSQPNIAESEQNFNMIVDFATSTGTVTAAKSLGIQAVTGVVCEIFESKVWNDVAIIDALNESQDTLAHILSDQALRPVLASGTTSGTQFGSQSLAFANFPGDCLRPISIEVDNVACGILDENQRWEFQTNPYVGNTTGAPIAIYSARTVSGNLLRGVDYRPMNLSTVRWYYVPDLSNVSASQDLQYPDQYADLLTTDTTLRMLGAGEKQVEPWFSRRNELVQAMNAQWSNR